MSIDDKTRTELEAAVFRRLVSHLRNRTDVQNIDLMNLAGFCRNCLSNWMKEEADAKGLAVSKDESREAVYGMPYEEWKAKYQGSATPDQLAAMKKAKGHMESLLLASGDEGETDTVKTLVGQVSDLTAAVARETALVAEKDAELAAQAARVAKLEHLNESVTQQVEEAVATATVPMKVSVDCVAVFDVWDSLTAVVYLWMARGVTGGAAQGASGDAGAGERQGAAGV